MAVMYDDSADDDVYLTHGLHTNYSPHEINETAKKA
jgi:hypothetical protein